MYQAIGDNNCLQDPHDIIGLPIAVIVLHFISPEKKKQQQRTCAKSNVSK